jgi:hypothetical protein
MKDALKIQKIYHFYIYTSYVHTQVFKKRKHFMSHVKRENKSLVNTSQIEALKFVFLYGTQKNYFPLNLCAQTYNVQMHIEIYRVVFLLF